MDSITLLTRSGVTALTPAADAQLNRELSAAYHILPCKSRRVVMDSMRRR